MRRNNVELKSVWKEIPDRGPETFSSTERVVVNPDELTLATVLEFVAMLRLVLKRSGLTAGQVAAKTAIARSSAYSLVSVKRTGLPVDPGQVQLFLCGCGLRHDQIDQVMRAWERLSADRRPRRGGNAVKPERLPRTEDLGVDACMEQIQTLRAAGELAVAVARAQRLTGALLAEGARSEA
ncbi:hypothetical protein ABZ342_44345 [Amycolatopsis sp. NPDC005961]|uniref:hypothetical protein n=1 Tax=Amycolatopsis sp. NPDC005961 TaxID=3156720 RepID=UPI0033F11DDD